MTNVVNLRMARKRKMRAQKEQATSENRASHGRSGAEKLRDRLENDAAERFVEGHRLDPDGRSRP